MSRTVPVVTYTNPMSTSYRSSRLGGGYAALAAATSKLGKLNSALTKAWYGPKSAPMYSTNKSGRGSGGYPGGPGPEDGRGAPHKKPYAGKRRRYRRRKPSTKKKVNKLTKSVKSIQQELKCNRSQLIYHARATSKLLSSVNSCSYFFYSPNPISTYETVLGQLRFFDSATPSSLVTADGSSGTYSRDWRFTTVYSKIEAWNNYQVPAWVTIYTVVPRADTSIGADTAFTNGLADVGNPTSTSPLIHLSDSPQFNKLWKIVEHKKSLLMPSECSCITESVKNVCYNPSITDSQTYTYQPRYKAFAYIVRVEGVIGHDSSADQQAQLAAGVDLCLVNKYVVSYDGGVELTYHYVTDSAPSFTNGGLVSSKPVSDNIGYSLA